MAFLGQTVFDKGIEVDPIKMKVVNNCPRNPSPLYIQCFLTYMNIIEGLS